MSYLATGDTTTLTTNVWVDPRNQTGTYPVNLLTVGDPVKVSRRIFPRVSFTKWYKHLRAAVEARRQEKISNNILPLMSGAAQETEVEKKFEHRKKIVLERKVGIPRDKGSIEEKATHTGKVTLVRSMKGTPPQVDNIGIKTESASSGHVEIPLDVLREALDELELPEIQKPKT